MREKGVVKKKSLEFHFCFVYSVCLFLLMAKFSLVMHKNRLTVQENTTILCAIQIYGTQPFR